MTENNYSHGAIAEEEGKVIHSGKHEVVMVVKFNSSEALILKEKINLTFYKFGNDTIIGTDGIFYTFYQKNWFPGNDAFAGRKFNLTMNDGEVVECNGEWWSARSKTAQMLVDQPLIEGTAYDLNSLQDCFVFYGYSADAEKWEKLRATYTGPVYDYSDGEFIIKSWLKRPAKLKCFITDYSGERCVVDENNDIFHFKVIQGRAYLKHSIHIGWHGLYKEFEQGKRNFNDKVKKKPVKPDFGKCTNCEKLDAWFEWDNGEYLCYPCNNHKERYEYTH